MTGTSQVPLEGFKGLVGMRGPQKFSVHRAYGENRLPTAHTSRSAKPVDAERRLLELHDFGTTYM